jgi:hypothetical protein
MLAKKVMIDGWLMISDESMNLNKDVVKAADV